MDVRMDYVTLPVSDGTPMRAYVARPTGSAPARGLLVFQEAFGVNGHIRDVTERFAREGYTAIAPELFHRSGQGLDIPYSDVQSAMAEIGKLTVPGMEADERAAYDWLRANGVGGDAPVAAVGFCMGGRAAFLAALTLPLSCAVSFYGGGIAPNPRSAGLLERVPELRVPVLLFWGGRDQHLAEAPAAVSAALKTAGKEYVQVEFSDAGHAFFCDARPAYEPKAAAQAWPLTLAFLNLHMSARGQSAAAAS